MTRPTKNSVCSTVSIITRGGIFNTDLRSTRATKVFCFASRTYGKSTEGVDESIVDRGLHLFRFLALLWSKLD